MKTTSKKIFFLDLASPHIFKFIGKRSLFHSSLLLVIATILFSTSSAWAKIDQVPYLRFIQFFGPSSATRTASEVELIAELHRAASEGQHALDYNEARRYLLGQIDLQSDGEDFYIKDVYCQKIYSHREWGDKSSIGPGLIPHSSVLNTEHTWPQSRFSSHFPKGIQKSDLHHLFPSDPKMNSARGNHKFAELEGVTKPLVCSASRLAKTSEGLRFEPPVEHRGNVARALFYFSIRYKINIDEDEEVFLKKWHQEDPVDTEELRRHDRIAEVQGNRNPFVVDPYLVEKISDF